MLLITPLVESVKFLVQGFNSGVLSIPPPPESIRSWPLVGKPLVIFWSLASQNIETAVQQLAPHLKVAGRWLLSTAENTGLGLLQFIVAIIISGVLLTQADTGKQFALMIAKRFAGVRGEPLTNLAQATIHSVALGILGVAAIQSVFAGLGFIVAGVPGAGLWALLCLFFSVLQLGIMWVVVPIIIYMFYHAEISIAIALLIWSTPVTFIDTFLKPILLSRGVETPMAVIFMGAIGGLLSSGIVGLFIGAIVLSLGYELFINWVKEGNKKTET